MIQDYQDPMEIVRHPALEALEDGFCTVDEEWRLTYWNAAAEREFGIARSDTVGRPIWEVVPFLRDGPTWAELNAVVSTGLPRRFIDAAPPPNGGFLVVTASPMDGGGVAIQFRDATLEIKREEQHAELLESLSDGFVAVDDNWEITYLNGAAERLLKFPRETAIGASLLKLLPRGPEEIRTCLGATMEDGVQRELREVRPEGRVYRNGVFDVIAYPLAGGGISILFQEVSGRVAREEALGRLVREADEANLAKGRFFAAVSHELRTPLTAIVGYTHLLVTDTYGTLPGEAVRAAERAGHCAEHLARLVDDILMLTTAEADRLALDISTVDLAEFLPPVIEPQRHQAEERGLDFAIDIDAGLPFINTDPGRLRQLIGSLLSNAVKFTSVGAVSIAVSVVEPGDDEPAAVEFAVTDTGPGISPEDQERIFSPFEQLGDESRSMSMTRGTGLGLTIAREVAERLGGRIFLANTSPAGSEFRLRIPVTSAAAG
jgi:PAS domain S-box-containing protein